MKMLLSRLQIRRAFPGVFATCVLLGATLVTYSAVPQDLPKDDPVLRAMQTELEREQAQLVLPGMQRPYFIEYRVDDFATYEAVANFGALVREAEGHQRIVRVTVRIGSYTTDSSSSRGDGTAMLAPTDNNPEAIRTCLWTATDEAYKNALRAYTAKLAALKHFETPPTEKDFAPAKAVTSIGPLVPLEIDREEWKRRIVEASGLYASDPEVRANAANVQYSSASLRGLAVNRYLVNTEGTVVRQGYAGYSANISVGGQAPDGMQLARNNGTHGGECQGDGDVAAVPQTRDRRPEEPGGAAQCSRRLRRGLPRAGAIQRRRGRGRDGPALRPQRGGGPAGDGYHGAHPGHLYVELPRARAARFSQRDGRSADENLCGASSAGRIRCGR